MRILYVTAGYPPESLGGVELHIAGLARAAAAAGDEPLVLARSGRPGLPHLGVLDETIEGVPVTRLGNTFEDATTFERLYDHPGLADAVGEQVRRLAPDVVHIHHLTCLSVGVIDRCRALGVPVVMTLHDFWMGCPRGQRITAGLDLCPEIKLGKCLPCLRELWPHVLGRGRAPDAPAEERDAGDMALLEAYHGRIHQVLGLVDQLITPSAFMQRMYAAYGVEAARIRVVENGLPRARWAAALAAAPRRVRGDGGRLRVGFIGSVLPSKGAHLAVAAVKRLGDPLGIALEVWGEVLPFHHDRGYGQRLQQQMAGFESAITLKGPYANEDLPGILAGLDVVVVPSIWYEAYGLTIREAFLAGVPVVTADHGAMAEAVRDGETGLLFRAGDSASLADALRRLADSPELRRRLAGSPDWVRDETETAAELREVYDRAVRSTRGEPG